MILARISDIQLEEAYPEKNGAKGYAAGDNPLGKIPALEWQPGQYLFDSPVICEYLDSLRGTPLLPRDGNVRYIQLWQQALGDGLADAVYNYRQETMRPENLHWDEMIERHETSIREAVLALNRITAGLGEGWTYGNLAVVCALDYATYRADHIAWRDIAPELAIWHSAFGDESAYLETYAYGDKT